MKQNFETFIRNHYTFLEAEELLKILNDKNVIHLFEEKIEQEIEQLEDKISSLEDDNDELEDDNDELEDEKDRKENEVRKLKRICYKRQIIINNLIKKLRNKNN